MSFAELEKQKKALLDLLNDNQKKRAEVVGVEGAIDIHHPERTPGWPQYKYRPFPKMMYHPAKLDPAHEAVRRGIKRRNEANPTLAPLDIPASKPLTRIVRDEEDKKKAEADGFVTTPPFLQVKEEEFYAEPAKADPLSDPAVVGTPVKTVDVAFVLKLSKMSKDELLAMAADKGIKTNEMTRDQLVEAIAQ